MVTLRQLSSDTIYAMLYFWKCILSFKTLQSAWRKALDDVLYNQKLSNEVKEGFFPLFISWG